MLFSGVVHQSGDRERLPVLQLDFRLGAARRQRRHAEAVEHDGVREVERADLGPDLQVDQVAAEDRRREIQPHAELLELIVTALPPVPDCTTG